MFTYLSKTLAVLVVATCATSHPTKSHGSAADLLDQVIDAVGGRNNLDKLSNIEIHSSTTLTQNHDLVRSDQTVAEAGAQNMTFSFASEGTLQQRVDRTYQYGDYWIWAFPDLNPQMEYSLVVQTGNDSSACFNKGRNSFYAFTEPTPLGYADPLLTDYLVRSAHQMALPYVLKQFDLRKQHLASNVIHDESLQTSFSTLYDKDLDLTLLIDDSTSFPYAIRSNEVHKVFGPSTSDVVFSNFTSVSNHNVTLILPHRIQTIYNDDAVLEDVTVDSIELNPSIPDDYFAAKPAPNAENRHRIKASQPQDKFTKADVHEFFEAGLWSSEFAQQYNTSSVVVKPVFPNGTTPQIQALYVGHADYIQLLVDFEDGLLITDAPAHTSKIVIDWVKENMNGKRITHVVLSHHHRDHAGGVGDFLEAGATLVVPEIAKSFYRKINNGHFKMETYSKDRPFVKQDRHARFQSFWHDDSSHARDWTYATVAPRCSKHQQSDDFVVYNVDVINPGPGTALRTDIVHAREFLLSAIADGVPTTATLIGSHGYTPYGLGTQESLENIAKLAGIKYPVRDMRNSHC